jgi:hypothetical protein
MEFGSTHLSRTCLPNRATLTEHSKTESRRFHHGAELSLKRPTRTDHEWSSNRDLWLKHSYLRRGATSGDRKDRMIVGHLGFVLLLLLGAIALRAAPLLSEQPIPIHRLNRPERQSDYSQEVARNAASAVSIRDVPDLRLLHRSPPRPEYVAPDCLPSFLADLVSGCVSLASHPPPMLS